jgi:RNA polymerase sigma factor (sigma-70 family)
MNAEEFKKRVFPVNQKLIRLSFRFLGNLPEAEDVVQEIYLKLWNMRHKLSDINNLEAFATTITKNLCLDKIKARRTVPLDEQLSYLNNRESLSEDPHQISENIDNMIFLKLIIDHLPEQQKILIILRDLEQYTFEEIEEITGQNLNYIRVNLSRGRKQIREALIKVHNYGTKQSKGTSGEVL